MSVTKIQWSEVVWNPVTGCSKVSQGCKNCYAERLWKKVYGFRPFTDVQLHTERLNDPYHWKRPRRVFVNSMSDLFHDKLSDEQILQVFAVMVANPRHVFQVLTKRPQRMRDFLWRVVPLPPNVWLGVSVEDQATADERIPLLLETQAAVRWISAEPLLGPIDFDSTHESDPCASNFLTGIEGQRVYDGKKCALDWVVVGGESGFKSKIRPTRLSWIASIVLQCQRAAVPVFVKQLGGLPVDDISTPVYGCTPKPQRFDSHRGDPQSWPEELRVREYPPG